MGRHRMLVLILGLAIACGSAFAIFHLSPAREKEVPVVVITKEMQPLERFTPDNVALMEISSKLAPPAAVLSLEGLFGKMAATALYPGEVLLSGRLCRGDIFAGKEERYLFIPYTSVACKRGELVDIYLSYTPGKSDYTGVERVLSGKVVAAIINDAGKDMQSGPLAPGQQQVQSGIEILVTHEEIMDYLDKVRFAKDVIVRHGSGGGSL